MAYHSGSAIICILVKQMDSQRVFLVLTRYNFFVQDDGVYIFHLSYVKENTQRSWNADICSLHTIQYVPERWTNFPNRLKMNYSNF